MSSATLNQEVSLPKNDIDSNDESISLTLTGCNKDKQESKCEPIRSNNEFIGLSKDSCNFDSLGFKTGMNENGISIKNKANLSRFNAFMSKLEDDLDDTAISKKFQIDDDEI